MPSPDWAQPGPCWGHRGCQCPAASVLWLRLWLALAGPRHWFTSEHSLRTQGTQQPPLTGHVGRNILVHFLKNNKIWKIFYIRSFPLGKPSKKSETFVMIFQLFSLIFWLISNIFEVISGEKKFPPKVLKKLIDFSLHFPENRGGSDPSVTNVTLFF